MKVSVMATPLNILPGALDGAAAIVIDALRMTSVAATALSNGCAGVLACAEVDSARQAASETGALLGGERNAVLIPGFDFSNSPLEYTAEKVAGRNLVMGTSNGTKAIAAASGAKRVLLAAFVNAKAAAEAVRGEEKTVIICAGTLGAFTLEDALAAGAPERLLKTVQICNSGIAPGSGVGNNRTALNRESVGIPVIAVGVPTVAALSNIAELPEDMADMIVTPREIDQAVEHASRTVAFALNRALYPSLSLEELTALVG